MKWLALASLIALTACADQTTITVDRPVLVEFPQEVMACPPIPARPVRGAAGIMESQVAEYVIDLRAMAEQCSAQMDALRGLYQAERDRLTGD